MSAGSGVNDDLREHYTRLPAGIELWHVFPSKCDARSFNPKSLNRFALPPPPGREMYYAAESSDCALWETVLRNLVVEDRQPQHIDPAVLENRSIARLKLTKETLILDLRSPHFRHLSTDPARHSEWQRLCVVPESDYSQTHAAARELLTVAPRTAGLCWPSRQIASQRAFVFYCSPVFPADFELTETIALDHPDGWRLVDQALNVIAVERLGAAALVNELLDELPPEDQQDDE